MYKVQLKVKTHTWFAINAEDIFPSLSSGHLGQLNLSQTLLADSPTCKSAGFCLIDEHMELNIGAHSKEQEQLGHVKVKGSQPRNLHFALSEEKYVHTVEKLAYQNVNKKMGKLGG